MKKENQKRRRRKVFVINKITKTNKQKPTNIKETYLNIETAKIETTHGSITEKTFF